MDVQPCLRRYRRGQVLVGFFAPTSGVQSPVFTLFTFTTSKSNRLCTLVSAGLLPYFTILYYRLAVVLR